MITNLSLHVTTGVNILDGGEFGEDRAGLLRWTEIPDVFLIHGRVGTTPDERVDPTKGDPLDDGDVVFRGIFDKLGVYVHVNDTGQGNSVTLTMSRLSMRLFGSSTGIVEMSASSMTVATRLNTRPASLTRGPRGT